MGLILYLTFLVSSLLTVVTEELAITQDCNFQGNPTTIEASNTLGRNVCIRQADTDPSTTSTWHFVVCQGANNFRVVGNRGNVSLCQSYDGRPGIGIDFLSGESTVSFLELVCENSSGTSIEVIEITVYIRPDGFIMYVPQSSDDKIDVTIGNTAVIAQFIGRLEDLELIMIPDGVQCNSTAEPDNCRFAASGGGSEFTMTCRETPQMLNGGGVRTFSRPGGAILARVEVNVLPNSTGRSPATDPPAELGVGDIVGIAVGAIVLVLLSIIVIVLITGFFYIRRVWHKNISLRNDLERGRLPLFDYVAFGRGIPPALTSSIINHYNVREFTLNGRSVEERFGESNERFLFVTKTSGHEEAIPPDDPESSLTAQMRQFAIGRGNRVCEVQLTNSELTGTENQLNTNVIAIINRHIQQQHQSSTERRILTIVQSLYSMVFQSRIERAPVGNGIGVPNGDVHGHDEEL